MSICSDMQYITAHPAVDSPHSLSLILKRHGGVATFAKDYAHAASRAYPDA